jgi:hypothetical protein
MERTEVNVETGEVKIIQYTPEEEATALAYAASLPPEEKQGPTLEQLQAQLASLTEQIQQFANKG